MWVKICGNTTVEDARLAAELGADALGFIFAEGSKRQISAAQATAMTRDIAAEFPHVARIGVVTAGTAQELAALVHEAGLDGLQLHGDAVQREAATLRAMLPELRIVAAFPWAGVENFARRLQIASTPERVFTALLVDSPVAQKLGGTGRTFDWSDAKTSFADAATAGVYAIAAGGLNPENVTEAIAILQPTGVDAVSGVEASPGQKDPRRLKAFLDAAKASGS
jgi:phosphoribosylanthranilate isomerase